MHSEPRTKYSHLAITPEADCTPIPVGETVGGRGWWENKKQKTIDLIWLLPLLLLLHLLHLLLLIYTLVLEEFVHVHVFECCCWAMVIVVWWWLVAMAVGIGVHFLVGWWW
jgi:hypothetical protein